MRILSTQRQRYKPPPPSPDQQSPSAFSWGAQNSPPRRIDPREAPNWMQPQRWYVGCLPWLAFALLIAAGVFVFLAAYLGFPRRTNVLLLGIDYTDPGNAVARSDTMIVSTYSPISPYVGLLSIPRDLWVSIPGFGDNRINTAHFFAEAQQPGSGPAAAITTVEQNFNIPINYYLRVRFEGFREIIDALGGLDIVLEQPVGEFPAGEYHLTGRKALALARSRYGSDDFFRMEHGQLILKSIMRQIILPKSWIHYPAVLNAIRRSITTNLPVWQWPRLAVALLRVGPDGIDNRTITREMAAPFTTDQGANVLLPNWPFIRLVVDDMFK